MDYHHVSLLDKFNSIILVKLTDKIAKVKTTKEKEALEVKHTELSEKERDRLQRAVNKLPDRYKDLKKVLQDFLDGKTTLKGSSYRLISWDTKYSIEGIQSQLQTIYTETIDRINNSDSYKAYTEAHKAVVAKINEGRLIEAQYDYERFTEEFETSFLVASLREETQIRAASDRLRRRMREGWESVVNLKNSELENPDTDVAVVKNKEWIPYVIEGTKVELQIHKDRADHDNSADDVDYFNKTEWKKDDLMSILIERGVFTEDDRTTQTKKHTRDQLVELVRETEPELNWLEQEVTVETATAKIMESHSELKEWSDNLKDRSKFRRSIQADLRNLKNKQSGKEVRSKSILDVDSTDYIVTDLEATELRDARGESIAKLPSLNRDLMAEHDAYLEFLGKIQALMGIERAVGPNGGFYSAVLYGEMPPLLKDSFDDGGLELGLFELFRKAIIDTEYVNKDMSAEELFTKQGNIEYDPDIVLSIMQEKVSKISVMADKTINIIRDETLSQSLSEIIKSDLEGDIPNLFRLSEMIRQVAEHKATIDEGLHETQGFILYVDSENEGKVEYDGGTKNVANYESIVKRSVDGKLRTILSDAHRANTLITSLEQDFSFVTTTLMELAFKDSEIDTEGITRFEELEWFTKQQVISRNLANVIMDNVTKIYSEPNLNIEVTIEKMGNGALDRIPANALGGMLVDFFHPEFDIFGRNPLAPKPTSKFEATSAMDGFSGDKKGQSLVVKSPTTGELNEVSPIGLINFAKSLDAALTRKRMQAIFSKKKFTKKEKEFIRRWIIKGISDPKARKGADIPPVALLPEFVGYTMEDRVITEAELKEFLTEIFFEMPHQSVQSIFDQYKKTDGFPLRWKDGLGMNIHLEGISQGSPMAVPFTGIGQVISVAMATPVPLGVLRASIKQSVREFDTFRNKPENITKSIEQLMEDATTDIDDRNFHVFVTLRMMQILADETNVKDWEKLVGQLERGDNKLEGFIKKGWSDQEPSYYISLALGTLRQPVDLDRADVVEGTFPAEEGMVGPLLANKELPETFKTIFNVLLDNGINSVKAWKAAEAKDDVIAKKLKALRGMFKIPQMRTAYSAGFAAFMREWVPSEFKSVRERAEKGMEAEQEGHKILLELEEAFKDEGIKFSETDIETFGRLIMKDRVGRGLTVVQQALAIGGESTAAILDFLQTRSSDDVTAVSWGELVNDTFNVSLDPENPIVMAETLEKQLDGLIERMTNIEEGVSLKGRAEKVEKIKAKYQERIDGIKSIIAGLRSQNDLLKLTAEHMEKDENLKDIFIGIMMGLRDPKTGAWKGESSRKLWSTQHWFKAINLYNSSAYKYNEARGKKLARILGLENIQNESDWMGLSDELLYHMGLQASMGARLFPTSTGKGMGPSGAWVERVASDPGKFDRELQAYFLENFNENFEGDFAQWEADDNTLNDQRKFFLEFMKEKDNRDSWGMWDLMDSPYAEHTTSEEKWNKFLEDIILRNNMLVYSQFGPPPIKGYNDHGFETEFFKDWQKYTDTIVDERLRQREFETELYIDSASEESLVGLLGHRTKVLGGVYDPEVARATETPMLNFSPAERTRVLNTNRTENFISLATENPRGFMAMQAPSHRLNYHRIGSLTLQRIALYKKLREEQGFFADIDLNNIKSDEDAMLPIDMLGWRNPYLDASLPRAMPITLEETRLLEKKGNREGRLTIRNLQQLRNWAAAHGLENEIINNQGDIPYYLLLMFAEHNADKHLQLASSQIVKSIKEGNQDALIRGVHSLKTRFAESILDITETARSIKNTEVPVLELEGDNRVVPINNPKMEGLTLRQILTSTPSAMSELSILYSQTKAHEDLMMGNVPIENVMYTLTDSEVPADATAFTETNWLGEVAQTTDMVFMILNPLWDRYIYKITQKLDEKFISKEQKKNLNDPITWFTLSEEAQLEIMEQLVPMIEKDGWNLEMDVLIEQMTETKEQKLLKQKRGILQNSNVKLRKGVPGLRGHEEVDVTLRHPLASVGLGHIRITGGRKLSTKQARVALTLNSSILMLMLNSNMSISRRIRGAYHLNKRMGVIENKDGSTRQDYNMTELAQEAVGFTMQEKIKGDVLLSESMKTIARIFNSKHPQLDEEGKPIESTLDLLKEILHDQWSTVDSLNVQLVDFDSYAQSRGTRREHIAVEVGLLPVTRLLTSTDVGKILGSNEDIAGDIYNPAKQAISEINRAISLIRGEVRGELAARFGGWEENYQEYLQLVSLGVLLKMPHLAENREALMDVVYSIAEIKEDLPSWLEVIQQASEQAYNWHRDIMGAIERTSRTLTPEAAALMPYVSSLVLELGRGNFTRSAKVTKYRDNNLIQNDGNLNIEGMKQFLYTRLKDKVFFYSKRKNLEERGIPNEEIEAYLDETQEYSSEFLENMKPDNYEAKFGAWVEEALSIVLGDLSTEETIKEETFAQSEHILDHDPASMEWTRSNKKFKEFASRVEDRASVEHLGNQITKLYTKGYINKEGAQILRAVLIRMWQHNQYSLDDITFEINEDTDLPTNNLGEAERKGGEYFVRIGKEGLSKDSNSVVSILVHEFSHIAVFKFLGSSANKALYSEWSNLMGSQDGRSFLRKQIIAWHNGNEAAAAPMINRLVNERKIDEFVAGYVQMYLLNDSQPMVDLTRNEKRIQDKTDSLTRKILRLFKNMFVKLHNVFAQFADQNPEMYSDVTKLTQKALGYAPTLANTKFAIKPIQDLTVDIPAKGFKTSTSLSIVQPRKPMDDKMSNEDYQTKAHEYFNLEDLELHIDQHQPTVAHKTEAKFETFLDTQLKPGLSDTSKTILEETWEDMKATGGFTYVESTLSELKTKIAKKRAEARSTLFEHGSQRHVRGDDSKTNPKPDKDHVYGGGPLTRMEFALAKEYMLARGYITEKEGKLDVTQLLEQPDVIGKSKVEGRMDVYHASRMLIEEHLLNVFGDVVSQGTGLGANKLLEKLSSTLFGEEGKYKLKDILTQLTMGSTGAHRTFNSHILIPKLLSKLLETRVVHTVGDYSQTAGVKSITEALNLITTMVSEQEAKFDKLTEALKKLPELKKQDLEEARHAVLVAAMTVADHGDAFIDGEDINLKLLLNKDGKSVNVIPDKYQSPEVIKQVKEIATSVRKSLEHMKNLAIESGYYQSGSETRVPFKLNRGVTHKSFTSFRDLMIEALQKHQLNNLGKGIIEPITAFYLGYLPNYTQKNKGINQLRKLRTKVPALYDYIIDLAIMGQDSTYKENHKKLSKGQKDKMRSEFFKQIIGKPTATVETTQTNTAWTLVTKAIIQTMENMGHGTLTFEKLAAYEGKDTKTAGIKQMKADLESNIRDNLKIEITQDTNAVKDLNHVGMNIPYTIFYQRGSERGVGIAEDAMLEMETPRDLHYYNFHNKAATGLYHPHQMNAVPSFMELAQIAQTIDDNGVILSHLITDPRTLIESHKKSTGDVILERQLLKDNFGIIATFEQMLSILELSYADENADFRHADGSIMTQDEISHVRESLTHLRTKHDNIRGIVKRRRAESAGYEWAAQMAPHIAKIAFGGNLAMASMLVEGMTGALHEAIGRGSITGAIKAILLPITGNAALGLEERKTMARDLSDTIKAVTHGRYTDFEAPASSVQKKFAVEFAEKWGNMMLVPARQVMQGIAASRAISTRNFIHDNFNNIVSLAKAMRHIEFDPSNENAKAELLGYMRKIGIKDFNINLVMYLVQSGLLNDVDLLVANDGPSLELFLNQAKADGRDYYSTTEIMEFINRRIVTDKETDEYSTKNKDDKNYANAHKILSALRFVEKAFIEEVLIAPSPFDIATGQRAEGELYSQSPFDVIWEVFQRYPMMFVGQNVIRKSSTWTPAKASFNLLGLLILDLLYMTLLRLAAGERYEDILEDFEDDPYGTTVKYGVRLPILGRQLGIIAQALQQAYSGYGPGGKGMVAWSAGEVVARDIGRGLKGGIAQMGTLFGADWGEAPYGSDYLNVLKHIPFVGESYGRIGAYLMADHVMAPEIGTPANQWFSGMRRRRSGGGGRGSGGAHQGIPTPIAGFTWEAMYSQLGRELFPQHKQAISQRAMRGQQQMARQQQQPVRQPQVAPIEPVQPLDTVGRLQSSPSQLRAPEGL